MLGGSSTLKARVVWLVIKKFPCTPAATIYGKGGKRREGGKRRGEGGIEEGREEGRGEGGGEMRGEERRR
jgi:hypothetical protein